MTEGKPFLIQCRAEGPISWFKDGEPIENHRARHGRENFTYFVHDIVLENLKGKIDSTLTVSKAVLRHKGKYQCNIRHENSHYLHVHRAPHVMDEEQRFTSSLESDDDHEEQRMRFENPLEGDIAMPSTMMRHTTPTVTQSTPFFKPAPEYDFEMSNEKTLSEETISPEERNEVNAEESNEKTLFEETISPEERNEANVVESNEKTLLEETISPEDQNEVNADDKRILEEIIEKKNFPQELSPEQFADYALPTASSSPAMPSLTNIPLHPTHATTHSNHVVHSTHVIPSEVQTQNHPDILRHKGSQNEKEMIRKKYFL